MNKVNIRTFIKRLIDKTNNDGCQWEELGSAKYRYVTRSGTIVFQYIAEQIPIPERYIINLYDQGVCFAVYDSENDYSEVGDLFRLLYNAIKEYFRRIIDGKIANMFDEI